MLSTNTMNQIVTSMAGNVTGNETLNAINLGQAAGLATGWAIPTVITATATSTTTNFAALAVNDLIVHIGASAGNAIFYKAVTAGTLPAAAVIGDLYIVLRAFVAPATQTIIL